MASLNKVMLIGNVGQDPELRYTPDGNPVANFSIAVNRRRRVGDEYKDETEWFNIVCFSRTAENVNQYLTKGQKVYVEGRFQSSEYVGQDGNQRKSFEVIANEVTFLSTKNEADSINQNAAQSTEKPEASATDNEDEDKDLPW
ncbi:MAG: single-stranded DNA-binding protein [Dehalococcoidia bacterium]|nr:single-stranded DNA-binding protein [Dehalococcoidia bacterium]|tara:strand:+ start:582 stop:1010 length:429 start_codon:yes stop_codon:yes gene_type:complete